MSKGQLRYNQHFCISLKKNQGLAWHFGLGKKLRCAIGRAHNCKWARLYACTGTRACVVCGLSVWNRLCIFPCPHRIPPTDQASATPAPVMPRLRSHQASQHRQDLSLPAANVTLETGAGSLWNHPRVLASPLMRPRLSWRMPFPESHGGVAAQPCTYTPHPKVWSLGHCAPWLSILCFITSLGPGQITGSGAPKPITEFLVSC